MASHFLKRKPAASFNPHYIKMDDPKWKQHSSETHISSQYSCEIVEVNEIKYCCRHLGRKPSLAISLNAKDKEKSMNETCQ